MLEIEIMSSPDPDYLGVWRFDKNQIYFGHPEGDVCVQGMLPSNAFLLEVLPGFLQVHPAAVLEFWLLNGKRSTKSRKVKLSDVIKVGELEFKVKDAEFVPSRTKKEVLDTKLKKLVAQNAKSLGIIQQLNAKTK